MFKKLLFGIICLQLWTIRPVISDAPHDLKPGVIEVPIKTIQSPSQYYTIAQSTDNWVVVLYEKWCGYSQITLKMLDELRKNQEFIKTGVSPLLSH